MPTFVQSWPFSYSNTTSEPPTGSQIRFDSVDPALVTKLWVRTFTSDNRDVKNLLLGILAGASLYLQDRDTSAQYLVVQTIGAAVDKGAYVELPVAFVQGVMLSGGTDMYAPVTIGTPSLPAVTGSGTPGELAQWTGATELGDATGGATPGPPASAFLIPPWGQPRSCFTLLVSAPTEEPLDVEAAKLAAAMTWPVTVPPDPRDAMTADFIKAAREKVEKDTGLALLTQVREVHFIEAVDFVPLPAQCTPVQLIEDVTARRSRVHLSRQNGVVGLVEVDAGTVLHVTAGWPSAAALKNEAPLLYHAVQLLTAHYLTLGRDVAITGAVASINVVPEGYEDTIQPYRLVWVA